MIADPATLIVQFGQDLAKNAAGAMVKHGAGLLKKATIGEDGAAAIEKCLSAALTQALLGLQEANTFLDDQVAGQVRDSVQYLLRSEDVGRAFIAAALAGRHDAPAPAKLLVDAGGEPNALPFDWKKFVDRFLAALEESLIEEASKRDLFQRVLLSSVRRRVRGRLAADVESRRDFVDRHTADLWQIQPENIYEQFLDEYLGLPNRPKPVGGRTHELDTLDDCSTSRISPRDFCCWRRPARGSRRCLPTG
jgi:hypothetical protein